MHNPPPWMITYIHQRVSDRATMFEAQTACQYELSKSPRLIWIEDRYRADKTVKMKKVRIERVTDENLWNL
jgi:hypothetical protein